MKKTLHLIVAALLLTQVHSFAESKKLKVFILAGQSNMEGHASIETFDYIGDDPATAPLLKMMRGEDGKPAVAKKTWISYLTGPHEGNANGEGTGMLTAGFGARGSKPTEDGGKIGPEFTFGLTMDTALKEPVLIIKTAWGGRSLNTQYRPPSAGPYVFSEAHLATLKKKGKDIEAEKAEREKDTGRFYKFMVDHVKSVLADPKRVCPEYDPAAGYEIAGFVWFQGFNDLVDGNTYPEDANGVNDYSQYSELMAHLIRDMRKDLNAPKMPVVIGVLGINGQNAEPSNLAFRKAMAAPASMPEFQGNVTAVETSPFWPEELADIYKRNREVKSAAKKNKSKNKKSSNEDDFINEDQQGESVKNAEADLITPEEAARLKRGASNAPYHYMGCAKTFAQIGKALAEANLKMFEHSGK